MQEHIKIAPRFFINILENILLPWRSSFCIILYMSLNFPAIRRHACLQTQNVNIKKSVKSKNLEKKNSFFSSRFNWENIKQAPETVALTSRQPADCCHLRLLSKMATLLTRFLCNRTSTTTAFFGECESNI